MKKRILCVVLSALMLLSAVSLFGCESAQPAAEGAAKTGEKITVILPRHEMDTIGFHEEKTRQFEKETGIEVELINMGWDQVADRLIADLTAGGGSYDVIEFDNAWVEKFTHNDWLEPLDGYVTDEIMSGMVPGLLDKFSADGHLYGITWNNDTRFYMYNKAKLDAAGIEKAPETWAEVVEDAKILKEKGLEAKMEEGTGIIKVKGVFNLTDVVTAASKQGVNIARVSTRDTDLETYFINLVGGHGHV